MPLRLLTILFLSTALAQAEAPKLNVANPTDHPYCNPAGNREGRAYADAQVNEARVYDFYSRQADYYLSRPEAPKLLPAYPGLDAGVHGHWGKHNQNQHQDGRWNDIDMGTVRAQVYRNSKFAIEKAVNIALPHGGLYAAFDPITANYRSLWEGGFVKFDPFRWGTSRNGSPGGAPWFEEKEGHAWQGGAIDYQGYSRHGDHVVFRYQVGESQILDFPCADKQGDAPFFTRTLEFPQGAAGLALKFAPGSLNAALDTRGEIDAVLEKQDGSHLLRIKTAQPGSHLILSLSQGLDPRALEYLSQIYGTLPSSLLQPGEPQWPDALATPAELGTAPQGVAYAIDTITPPFDNPWKSVLQLSGIDFLPDGDAIISNLAGDVWKVSGLGDDLQNVTWKRFATGLNQPIGVHIDADGIFVLCRDQLTRLHDLDDDGEADFYQCFANDFGGYDKSHTHVFGLHRGEDGAFSFVRREQICRTSAEGVTREIAFGVRNCMGVGGAPDGTFLVAPQEGTWTPTSAIIEVSEGDFYGLPGKAKNDAQHAPSSIAAPLCFVPRAIDNSTGGMTYISSDKWGPFQGSFVGLSYGYNQHYLILRDTEGTRPQGAIVPLEGEFASGVMRGAFHPGDGQLYTVGLDGWGDYSTHDGCLHRVRHTGDTPLKPNGFHAYSNGLRIDFPFALDPASASPEKLFAQQWNYEYSKQYGSPEYSVSQPSSLGHDRLEIATAKVINGGRSLFVELPKITPVMQLHLRIHLSSSDGQAFDTDLFTTVHELTHRWTPEGAVPEAQPQQLALRFRESGAQERITETGKLVEGERKLVLHAASGLKFQETEFTAAPGEPLVLHFINSDVMPHNVVFVREGAVQKVGEASFRMLNDPKAAEKHYVPDMGEVMAHTHVINPGNTHILHFRAPKTPGDHHFVCTFPGHWMTMQGLLKVREKP